MVLRLGTGTGILLRDEPGLSSCLGFTVVFLGILFMAYFFITEMGSNNINQPKKNGSYPRYSKLSPICLFELSERDKLFTSEGLTIGLTSISSIENLVSKSSRVNSPSSI